MFFKKKSLGLDISDYSIEIVSLEEPLYNPRLLAMGAALIEPGIFDNGKIVRSNALKKILKNLLKKPKFGRIKTNKVVFSIPESESFILSQNLKEEVREKDVEEYAQSQIKRNFPYPPEELDFDYWFSEQEIFIAAAPKEIVKSYLEVIRGVGLKPLAVEIESISLGRAIIKEKKPTLIADIGAQFSNFSVFDGGKLKLSFSLPIAGKNFTAALAQKLDISEEKAQILKRKVGLDPQPEKGRVFLILQKEMNEIVAEIKKIDEYFLEKTGKRIEKIILAGGSSSLPRILEYFQENLEKTVEIGDPWDKIDIDLLNQKEYLHDAHKVNPVIYATTIGLALRGLAKNPARSEINLLKF